MSQNIEIEFKNMLTKEEFISIQIPFSALNPLISLNKKIIISIHWILL